MLGIITTSIIITALFITAPLGSHIWVSCITEKQKRCSEKGLVANKTYNNRVSVTLLSHDTLRPLPHKVTPADRRVLEGVWRGYVDAKGQSCAGRKRYRRLCQGLSEHISYSVSIELWQTLRQPCIPGGGCRHKQLGEHS